MVRGATVKPVATAGSGDATRIAREAVAAGADLVLVLGGDGTINEAVNGMVHSSAILGVLPGGTANVLAMELGLGSRLDRAIERLSQCAPRRVSVGRVSIGGVSGELSQNGASKSEVPRIGGTGPVSPARRKPTGCSAEGLRGAPDAGALDSGVLHTAALHNGERHFLAMGGAGLDAQIVFDLSPGFKARAGKLAYWLTAFGRATHRVGQFEACIDGHTYRCGFVLASRVRNYGGDLEIASGASLARDDFEIVLFEGSHPLRYLWYMLGVSMKRVQSMAGVHTVRGGRLELMGDVHLQVDGEYAGRLPASIDIVPAAITLLMPPDYR